MTENTEKKGSLLGNLVKKAVGLPTGQSSCCGPKLPEPAAKVEPGQSCGCNAEKPKA